MSKSTVTSDLRKVERAWAKIKNKLHRADLDYTVQFSVNSTDPTKVSYAVQMTAPAYGLGPITIIDVNTVDTLLEQIKAFEKDLDYRRVEIAFHKAQIQACARTIQAHEEAIKELEENEDYNLGLGEPEPEKTEEKDLTAEPEA